jgi:hypothetical protein
VYKFLYLPPHPKKEKKKRKNVLFWTRDMAQVVKHLPAKYKVLSSNPKTSKKKKKFMLLLT